MRLFPSSFAAKQAISKIHISLDSLPNGSLGYLIYWTLTITIAFGTLSFLNVSSLKYSKNTSAGEIK